MNDVTDENKGMYISNRIKRKVFYFMVKDNWSQTCDRIIELIEANELAQMNTADLQTYTKLINELDSAIESYKLTILK